MAYSDNYPNGHKSGYSSADDPDRIDYSPMGAEIARVRTMKENEQMESRMSQYQAGLEREKQRQQKIQERYEQEELEKQQSRLKSEKKAQQHSEAVNYLASQKRKDYKNKSWFIRAWLTIRGKGYYKTPFWDLAKAEVDAMSDKELDNFYKENVR